MKILLLAALALLAWWAIDRLGLWLHKKNDDGLHDSLDRLRYAAGPIGRIQGALNARQGNGTVDGLGSAIQTYVIDTVVNGKNPDTAALLLMCDHSSDDVMLATTIVDEFRNKSLVPSLAPELERRSSSSTDGYVCFVWEVSRKFASSDADFLRVS